MSKTIFFRIATLSLVASHLSLFSCNIRNPNLSEKQLLALATDTTRKTAETPAFVFPDTSYVPPVGAKYAEIRSVDPASPPVTLKVAIPEGAKQPLKLSLFGSSVEYVTLQLPGENDFFMSATHTTISFGRGSSGNYVSTQVNMLGNHFVTSDALGVRLFGPSGKFVQNLLLSEFEGSERNIQNVKIDFDGYKRATLNEISGTRCLLTYIDFGEEKNVMDLVRGNGEKNWAGEFDLSKMPLYTPQSEILSTQGVEMVPVRSAPSGLLFDDNTRFSFRIPFNRNLIAISFNNMGDTLCKFTNHVVGNGGAYVTDRSFFYRANDELFFRQEFCDTIFRVQSANRIVPAYRFDFGALRLTPNEGATGNTQGKLVPKNWLVFKNSMLLIFSQARDCPDCRARNEVTFHCLLFDKYTGNSTAIDMKSQYPENILIENDIDGGLPIPLNSLHTEGDVMMAIFTKFQLKKS